MHILVVGGTGQVGQALVPLLVAQGNEVTTIGRRRMESDDRVSAVSMNISEPFALAKLLDKNRFDGVIHLAASNALATDEEIKEVNINGTRTLLNAVKEGLAVGTPVVLVSSSAVYGAATEDPITEETPLAPTGPYGLSKLWIENAGAEMFRLTGHRIIAARPFNVIGPGQRAPLLHSVVAAQVVAIERGLMPPIIETGALDSYRDFVDVRDVAQGLAILCQVGRAGEAYNLCSGRAIRADRLVSDILALTVAAGEIEISERKSKSGGVPYQRGSSAKILREAGWSAEIPLSASVANLLAFWRNSDDSDLIPYISQKHMANG